MSHKVALYHRTSYRYDRPIRLGPQIVRLKPCSHSRTTIDSYSLRISPTPHFVNVIQDAYGNLLSRIVFPDPVTHFDVEVDLIANLKVYNPFDFFLEPECLNFPYELTSVQKSELAPYLIEVERSELFDRFLRSIPTQKQSTIDFLVALNRRVQEAVSYNVRMEPNVQTPQETLKIGRGSCRDSALLLVHALRAFGFPARFVSGYLIQLVADEKAQDGPSGPDKDFTDLHAWAEAYVPGAGWIGLDATSGLLAGEGHIPLAATPLPGSAAPVEGLLEACNVTFDHEMKIERLERGPRPLKPFGDSLEAQSAGREALDRVGEAVDRRIRALGFTLTMGGEPTFVSQTDRHSSEWGADALGETKKKLAFDLMNRLKTAWGAGGVIHNAQGKWYPGEPLPRWALSFFWRKDGKPLWKNPALLADESVQRSFTAEHARAFMIALTKQLGVEERFVIPAYEDPMHFLSKERDLPVNVTPGDNKLKNTEDRQRMIDAFHRGLDQPSGFVLPLQKGSWKSGPWPLRSGKLVLIPGDSPIGLRLPLDSLPWSAEYEKDAWFPVDPMQGVRGPFRTKKESETPVQKIQEMPLPAEHPPLVAGESAAWIVRTALCIQPRGGQLYAFMPPVREASDWFALLEEIEATAETLGYPIVVEGYRPPSDPRILDFQITPDPGVVEVNLPPAEDWAQWKKTLADLYEHAEAARLSTEKYQLGGQVVSTGGGCHWVLGGPQPSESVFLKRPDLLRSWMAYTNRHPSLSYAFAGLFVGPTSQAPRSDEAQPHLLHDLEIAFDEVDRSKNVLPWLTDRIFRNLLVDGSGNTHRSEISIDKLFSPDSASGRRGLVEFRAYEMPRTLDMALAQSLTIRALTTMFLEQPYSEKPVRWGCALTDRWMLGHFLWEDFLEIHRDLSNVGLELPLEPFVAHWEFRFPVLGRFEVEGMEIELRAALEPWPVMGEESSGGGTVRYVDSSVERVQISVKNWRSDRYALACNGLRVPLASVDAHEGVAGIRFKAWRLASGLHPTLDVHDKLVVDVFDLYSKRVVAGCTYHVAHPAGRAYETPPVNSFEAEARRSARFSIDGHTPGPLTSIPQLFVDPEFPHTLDLRRKRG